MRGAWTWWVTWSLLACSVDTQGFPGVASGPADGSMTAGEDTAGAPAAGTTGGATTGGTGTAGSDGPLDTSGSPDSTADTGAATSAAGSESGTTSAPSTTSDGAGVGPCGGTPLDPQLDVPPLCAPTCSSIGYGSDCPGIDICRLKDSATAVCETCEPCGNLHAPCSASAECDILFTCFMGQCTAMCDFDTPQTCGNPAACTDVGHPTHGVCDPTM